MTVRRNLEDRFARYAGRIIRLSSTLPSDLPISRHLSDQLARSATSAGANYSEACGASSRRDFVAKLRIADKEARESRYWLAVCRELDLPNGESISSLIVEGDELISILSSSIRTAVGGKNRGA